jgi:hypothetical protein
LLKKHNIAALYYRGNIDVLFFYIGAWSERDKLILQ